MNTPIDLNDPRISAYALGEMAPEERADFEAQLDRQPEVRAEVEAIRALGGDLEQAFANEQPLTLRPEQKTLIASTAVRPTRTGTGRVVGIAAAAVVLAAVGVLVNMEPPVVGRPASNEEITIAKDAISNDWGKPELGEALRAVPERPVAENKPRKPQDRMARAVTKRRWHSGGSLHGPRSGGSGRPVDAPMADPRAGSGGGSGGTPVDGKTRQRDQAFEAPGGSPVREAGKRLRNPGGGVSPYLREPSDATPPPPPPPPTTGTPTGPVPAPSPTPAIQPTPTTIEVGGLAGGTYGVRFHGWSADEWRVMIDGLKQTKFRPEVQFKAVVADLRQYEDALIAGDMNRAKAVFGRLETQGVPRNVFLRLRAPQQTPPTQGTEAYQQLVDNRFETTSKRHTSTFSIDVDTASYANVRRMLMRQDKLPPTDAVRIEEFINAFDYGYEKPGADAPHPIAMRGDVVACPWNPDHRLARIALQAHEVGDKRPTLNLVFLIDVSGSMQSQNKLPLVKRGLSMLLETLRPEDRVGIVTYASSVQVRLQSTVASESAAIQSVIEGLHAGGSTNGAGGIQKAYAMARQHFIQGAANRVILATDGDFNVGISDDAELEKLIAKEAAGGIDLSVLGFGMGNLKDGKLERLSNRGNGNYAYIDSVDEARKALVDDMLGTLVTIARDVKIQIFFNPRKVRSWRLIGYANRQLRARDFNDDTKDAGEIGSGHAVTALYEIVPVGAPAPRKDVDPNPFVPPQQPKEKPAPVVENDSNAMFRLRLRYKRPDQTASELVEADVTDTGATFDKADDDVQWATAVAGFGMVLRNSRYAPGLSLAAVEEMAKAAAGDDPARKGFLEVLAKARKLRGE